MNNTSAKQDSSIDQAQRERDSYSNTIGELLEIIEDLDKLIGERDAKIDQLESDIVDLQNS